MWPKVVTEVAEAVAEEVAEEVAEDLRWLIVGLRVVAAVTVAA